MSVKNIYTNPANITPLPEFQGEVTPKTTAFAPVQGENVVFDVEDILKYPTNLSSLKAQPLNEFTRHVLGVIGSYEFVTTKMIADILNLLGIQADSKHVLTACSRLRKTGLIHAFRFRCEDDSRPTSYVVYTLSKPAGESALHSLGISVGQFESYNVVMEPANVKKKLATNQVLFAHLKHNGAVTGFEKSKRYMASDKTTDEHIAVKPSLFITFRDKSSLFYEVVRKSLFWQTELENKLSRYRILRDNWELPGEMPPLVICCEDEQHAGEVKEIVLKSGLEVFYTHDLLLFGESFSRHLFTIGDNDEILRFKISFDESGPEKTL